jgi:hypothetical protein
MEDSSLDTYHSIHDNHPLVRTGHGSFLERPRYPLHDKVGLSQCRTPKDIFSALYGTPMAFFTTKPMQFESSLAIGYYQKALHDTVDVQPQSQPLREPSRQSTRDTIQASTMRLQFRTPPSQEHAWNGECEGVRASAGSNVQFGVYSFVNITTEWTIIQYITLHRCIDDL